MEKGRLCEIFYVVTDEETSLDGAYLITDLDKWLSNDWNWRAGAFGEPLQLGDTVMPLGEICMRSVSFSGEDGDHTKEFCYERVVTRLGVGWVSPTMLRAVEHA